MSDKDEPRNRPKKLFRFLIAYGPYKKGDTFQPTGMLRQVLVSQKVISEIVVLGVDAQNKEITTTVAELEAKARAEEKAYRLNQDSRRMGEDPPMVLTAGGSTPEQLNEASRRVGEDPPEGGTLRLPQKRVSGRR